MDSMAWGIKPTAAIATSDKLKWTQLFGQLGRATGADLKESTTGFKGINN
ncbi:MAG: hypothetical protein F6K19_40630 [Cyanothece sp. SIO1E1]|nr:hypothetical protein [Cyanothece sp. SIO1E1]